MIRVVFFLIVLNSCNLSSVSDDESAKGGNPKINTIKNEDIILKVRNVDSSMLSARKIDGTIFTCRMISILNNSDSSIYAVKDSIRDRYKPTGFSIFFDNQASLVIREDYAKYSIIEVKPQKEINLFIQLHIPQKAYDSALVDISLFKDDAFEKHFTKQIMIYKN